MNRVVRCLSDRDIQYFAPKTLSDAGRLIWLMPSFLFVVVQWVTRGILRNGQDQTSLDAFLNDLLKISGVKGIKTFNNDSVILHPKHAEQVDNFRARTQGADNVIVLADRSPKSIYTCGQSVKITEGLFAGRNAVFLRNIGLDRCSVSINVFGRQTDIVIKRQLLVADLCEDLTTIVNAA